jgi:hypothetical protein
MPEKPSKEEIRRCDDFLDEFLAMLNQLQEKHNVCLLSMRDGLIELEDRDRVIAREDKKNKKLLDFNIDDALKEIQELAKKK